MTDELGICKRARTINLEIVVTKKNYANALLVKDMKNIIWYSGRLEQLGKEYEELTGRPNENLKEFYSNRRPNYG